MLSINSQLSVWFYVVNITKFVKSVHIAIREYCQYGRVGENQLNINM